MSWLRSSKPTLYIPDQIEYGDPFKLQFKIVFGGGWDNVKHEDMKKCDYLMLTGGGDIGPEYYGQEVNPDARVNGSFHRDEKEYSLVNEAISAGKRIIGICRGAQWLGILGGGSLFQDITGHHGDHVIQTTSNTFPRVLVSSSHHQMVNLTGVSDPILLGWTLGLSQKYVGEKGEIDYKDLKVKEPEVFYIPSLLGLGIQGHPEYMKEYSIGNSYYRSVIDDLFLKG